MDPVTKRSKGLGGVDLEGNLGLAHFLLAHTVTLETDSSYAWMMTAFAGFLLVGIKPAGIGGQHV